jgi:Mrp family chromosome partitioning ATPase
LQVTSSVPHEGKTLVAINLAATLAQRSEAKVLVVEGDLHSPTLGALLGLGELRGITHWWAGQGQEISSALYRVNQLPLWFLPAGGAFAQPSNILQSPRFAEALARLYGAFDWIIVDSTPLLPFADVNLWSRLLDGMLLVIREGVASVKALKKGLEAIDNLKLVGVVLNDASELDRSNYKSQYSAVPRYSPGQS